MEIKGALGLPFEEAINFFTNKLQLPTESYTDIWREQHSHAFVVAGANKDALVEDFYNAIHKAMRDGTGLKAFQNDFNAIVEKHGWSHHGSAEWRSRLIYDTNIRQAYNAGKWQQMWSVAHLRPYLQYIHITIVNPRIDHQALDKLVVPIEDPFWQYYMPQNGYGCQCQVRSLARFEAEDIWSKNGRGGPDIPSDLTWSEVTVGKNGSNPRAVKVPTVTINGKKASIDPGFAYNPGKAWLDPLTTPPLRGYDAVLTKRTDSTLLVDTARLILPTPTPIKSALLLQKTMTPEAATGEFLSLFGATTDKGVVFDDAVNTHVVITKRLFADESGAILPLAEQQIESMNLMAMSLIEPDEVWWHWEQDKGDNETGRWRLKRRYIRLFQLADSTGFAVTAFEWNRGTGWASDTAFFSDGIDEAINDYRIGVPMYKKDVK